MMNSAVRADAVDKEMYFLELSALLPRGSSMLIYTPSKAIRSCLQLLEALL
ncbi:hypothetical protein CCR75_000470 [Bremia lactucae]|uniref:Uncharacterized protein n=1 Tax=Bremia lactucae TaxID=4779 RepID=A0A976FKK5_BRELC|nr:hypothetical protein CCR75_000470 [Bremia lactucae]